jgi:uncharacterized protein (TIGR00730 family)
VISICVFGGAQEGTDSRYRQSAAELGRAIAARGCMLVYGGGSVGLMGYVAQSALDNGGEVTGIIPQFLAHKEVLHQGLTRTILVTDLFERKARMIELSDAFIALPGGIGTLDELLEVVAWRQLQQLHKPIGVLDTAAYFEPWFGALRHAVSQGFTDADHVDGIVRAKDSDTLLEALGPGRETQL